MVNCKKITCLYYDETMTDHCARFEPPKVEGCTFRVGLREQNEELRAEVEQLKEAARHQSDHPQKCPITGRDFFMVIEHPERGDVATYGGPFDSYTIPERDNDGMLCCERYDHDAGHWVDGGEMIGLLVVAEKDILRACDECDGDGWVQNRVEARGACTCMIEAEPFQILLEALEQIQKAATGEIQIADDDTEGMGWIAKEAAKALHSVLPLDYPAEAVRG